MSHDLDPYGNGTERTKECATCGDRTSAADDNGKPQCADCMGIQERRNSAILDFHNALPADLQACFDTADAVFDSGHEVEFSGGMYRVWFPMEFTDYMWLEEAIQWCIAHRGVLV